MKNAGGHIEAEEKKSNEDLELDVNKEGDARGSISSSESDESSIEATSDEVDSAVPLMSEEEESDIDVKKAVDSFEKELSRRHKLRLVVSKGSVIVVSCAVLLVGVVLAAVLHHDYSSCELEEEAMASASALVSSAALHSTSATPLPTPINY